MSPSADSGRNWPKAVVYGSGRMARAIFNASTDDSRSKAGGIEIIGVCSRTRPDWSEPVNHWSRLEQIDEHPDVLIDFTLPDGTASAAAWCAASNVALLSGVTGLDDTAQQALKDAARQVPVLWSANMSVGVNVLAALCQSAAAALPDDCEIKIHDVHHQWKKDAPSGTALMLGEAVSGGVRDDSVPVTFTSVRVGEVIGRHAVHFECHGEVIGLVHEATDRSVFAFGALQAAAWLVDQAPGWYAARDWIGETWKSPHGALDTGGPPR